MKSVSAIIDIGTSSLRVSFLDQDFSWVDSEVMARTANTCFSAEGEWEKICGLIRELVRRHSDDCKVTGIAASALVGWVACDRNGRALTDCMTYMHQCPEQLSKLLKIISADEVYSINGRRPSPELGALKLAMLKETIPEVYEKTSFFVDLKDFINLKLTGKASMDPTSACYTMVYDINTASWSKRLLDALGLDGQKLPSLLESTCRLGTILPGIARKLGLPEGISVAVGGPDGSTGILGAGGIKPGTAVSVMGTTDVFFAISERRVLERSGNLVTNLHVIPGLWLIGGPMGMSGGTLNWYQQKILGKARSLKELDGLAAELPPGCGGVHFLPSLAGERAPFWNAQMRGTVSGLEIGHSAEYLHRAILEANGYTTRKICELCAQSGIEFSEIIAIGGGSKSDIWLQIKADITRKLFSVADVPEATTLGSAMMLSISEGKHLEDLPMPRRKKTFHPDFSASDQYDPLYRDYLRFYEYACKFYQGL